MNNKYKALLATAMAAPLLLTTGCIEEVLPTSGLVQSQLEASSKATEALVWAMPAHHNQVGTVSTSVHYDWGQGSLMHIRDVMTADMAVVYSGYNWFSSWSSANIGLDDGYMSTQFVWVFQTEQVLTTNKAIAAIDPETTDPTLQGYLGAALAFRASTYLDMARMYEFLPNNYLPATNAYANDVTGYTVPIVTEKTTETEARNNPRATHQEMVDFILNDLNEAVGLLKTATARTAKTIPDLAVAYGLMARTYLWDATYHEEGLPFASDESAASLYEKAAEYARLAYTTHGANNVTTQAEWLDTTTGFNNIDTPSWMWGMQYTSEDNAVISALLNWTSWMSNETTFGYASAAPFVQIGASVYNRISDRDFRKLSWVAPSSSPLSGREQYVDKEFAAEHFKEYYSLKFRPGSGNMTDNKICCVVAVPLMRTEEMYFIEAEAKAHVNVQEGLQLLTDFMKKFRYASYFTDASTLEDAVDEIVFQKRVELWGEGQAYFDIKRLNMDVYRVYNGTNFNWGQDTYNSDGRPSWMNFVITRGECNTNRGLTEWNNPNAGNKQSVINQ